MKGRRGLLARAAFSVFPTLAATPAAFQCQGDACGNMPMNSAEFMGIFPAAALRARPRGPYTCAARGIFSKAHVLGKNIWNWGVRLRGAAVPPPQRKGKRAFPSIQSVQASAHGGPRCLSCVELIPGGNRNTGRRGRRPLHTNVVDSDNDAKSRGGPPREAAPAVCKSPL